MYNNRFTSSLTDAEMQLIHRALNEYKDLLYVNIIGLELSEDEPILVDKHSDSIEQAMLEMHICISSQLSMSDAQCESIWSMFQDAIDQYDISDGTEVIRDEDDREMAIHVCQLLNRQ